MSKKKIFMSVTASAVIATTLLSTQDVSAASYTVKRGDTLWSISQQHGTSITQLKLINNLNNDIIYPNQVLTVKATSQAPNNKQQTNKAQTNKTATKPNNVTSQKTYTVVSGDTLSKIAAKHGVTVRQLKDWNKLSSDLIYPGNRLIVNNNNSTPATNQSNANSNSTAQNNSNNTNTQTNTTTKPANATATYTVVSGDSLSKIAAQHNISLKNLMAWNNLTTTLIYPGDKLIVRQATANKTETTQNNNNNRNTTNSSTNQNNSSDQNKSSTTTNGASTYTVKSGDTLSKIASMHKITLQQLKEWNNKNSHIIYPGEILVVGTSQATSANNNQQEQANQIAGQALIDLATSVIGTKYTWAGSSLSEGFDCSGFIYWAFNEAGQQIGRHSSEGYYNRSYIVNTPQVGDLVFFENTYKKGISHMGIYLGNNQFIHAAESSGVTITSLDHSYWKKHFHSFKRFY